MFSRGKRRSPPSFTCHSSTGRTAKVHQTHTTHREKEKTSHNVSHDHQQFSSGPDENEFKAKMKEFSTFQLPFSQQKIEFLLETVKANMKYSKDTLLREIAKAVIRRHIKASDGVPVSI